MPFLFPFFLKLLFLLVLVISAGCNAFVVLYPTDPQPVNLDPINGPFDFRLAPGIYNWNETTNIPASNISSFSFSALEPENPPLIQCQLADINVLLFHLFSSSHLDIRNFNVFNCSQLVYTESSTNLTIDGLDASQFGLLFINSQGSFVSITGSCFHDTNYTEAEQYAANSNIYLEQADVVIIRDNIVYNITTSFFLTISLCRYAIIENYFATDIVNYYGGSHNFADTNEVMVNNATFMNIITPTLFGFSGAAVYIQTMLENTTAWVSDSTFIGNVNVDPAYGTGSGLTLDQQGSSNIYLTALINNCSFIENNATSAAAIEADGANMKISNSSFIGNIASTSSAIEITLRSAKTKIIDSIFQNNQGSSVIISESSPLLMNNVTFTENYSQGAFLISSQMCTFVQIINSDFIYNYADGVIGVDSSELLLSGALIMNTIPFLPSTAIESIIKVTGDSDVLIIDSLIGSNLFFDNMIFISITADVVIENNYFQNNTASLSAAISIVQAHTVTLYNNSAADSACLNDPRYNVDFGPCALIHLDKFISNITIESLDAQNVSATGIVSYVTTNISISSVSFNQVTSAIYLVGRNGKATISNSSFSGLNPPDGSVPALAQFLSNSESTIIIFDNVNVQDSSATLINLVGPGSVQIMNSFFNNTGTILVAADQSHSLLSNVTALNITATAALTTDSTKLSGAVLYLSDFASSSVIGGLFDVGYGQEGGFASVRENANLMVSGGTMIMNYYSTHDSDGGAVYVDPGASLSVQNASFSNNVARNGAGGAIYITNDATNSVRFGQHVSFRNNSAVYGGAVFFGGIAGVNISTVSFSNNLASIGNDMLSNAASIAPSSNMIGDIWHLTVDRSGAMVNNASVILLDSFGQFLPRGDIFFHVVAQSNTMISNQLSTSLFNCASSPFLLSGETSELLSNGKATFTSLSAHGCAGTYPVLITTDNVVRQYPSSQFFINATITIPGCPPGYSLMNPSLQGSDSTEQFLTCTPCLIGTFTTNVDTIGDCLIPSAGMYTADNINVIPCDSQGFQMGLCPDQDIISIPVMITLAVTGILIFGVGLVGTLWWRKKALQRKKLLGNFIDASEVEIGELLGTGAFGVVRAGIFRGGRVAIKRLNNNLFIEAENSSKKKSSFFSSKVYPQPQDVDRNEDESHPNELSIEKSIRTAISSSRKSKGKINNPEAIELEMENTLKSRGSKTSGRNVFMRAIHVITTGDMPEEDMQRIQQKQEEKQEVNLQELINLLEEEIMMLAAACLDRKNMFVVLELMPMGPLDKLLQSTFTIPHERLLQMAIDACSGMVYLHSNDPIILHCDLKSSNLLVAADLTVKVSDFGMSYMTENRKFSLEGKRMGTMLWMAPEVIIGVAYLPQSDVYSMTIILWEILHRKAPYSDLDIIHDEDRFYDAVVQDGIRPTINPKVGKLIMEILEMGWHRRFRSRPSMERLKDMVVEMMRIYLEKKRGKKMKTKEEKHREKNKKRKKVKEANQEPEVRRPAEILRSSSIE